MVRTKYLLNESELPTHWYNIVPDLPTPLPPPLHPQTHQQLPRDALAQLLPPPLVEQEISTERFIEIPAAVLDIYKLWRPTPLFRAHRLERALNTPAKIFYKYEGVSPAGSHKLNSAVPQVYYNKLSGTRCITTETGAGQWGSALAFACAQFDLECAVWQVRTSYDSKPSRRTMMQLWGAQVYPSPSNCTEVGREILKRDSNTPGSLGIAIAEATEASVKEEGTKYALGSFLNHVLMHQTVIGEEALVQMGKTGLTPDVLIGCTGGGSNFAGLSFPFLREKLAGKNDVTIRCVEPAACPSLTKGEYRYDFADFAGTTPLFKMHTLGHSFVPDPIHAGGLRYHGMAPLVSHLYAGGLIEAEAISQNECFGAGQLFARTEGIVAAPEPTHAIAAVIREAKRAKEMGEQKVILMALCGHGHMDLGSYECFLKKELKDLNYADQRVKVAMAQVPVLAEGQNGNV